MMRSFAESTSIPGISFHNPYKWEMLPFLSWAFTPSARNGRPTNRDKNLRLAMFFMVMFALA
jgi:hypothetical protein